MFRARRPSAPAVVALTKIAFAWLAVAGASAAAPAPAPQKPGSEAGADDDGRQDASRPQTRRGGPRRPAAPGAAIVLENVRVLRPGEPELDKATIVVRGKRILAVGTKVAVPENARRIDGAGAVVTAGWIDARGETPLDPASADDGAPNAEFRAEDALDLLDREGRMADALSQGIAVSYVAAGRGLQGGTGVLVRLKPGATDAESLTVEEAKALTIVGGFARGFQTVARLTDWANLRRTLRDAQKRREALAQYEEDLEKFLEAKRKGAKTAPRGASETKDKPAETPVRPPVPVPRGRRPPRSEEEREFLAIARILGIPAIVEGRDGGVFLEEGAPEDLTLEVLEGDEDCGCGSPGPHSHHPPGGIAPLYAWQDPSPPRPGDAQPGEKAVERPKRPDFNPGLTLLVSALRREIPVRFEVRRIDEIRAAIALAKEFRLRAVLEGLDEGIHVIDEIAASGFPVVLAPVHDPAAPAASLTLGFEGTASLAAACAKRKIPFAIGTGRGAHTTAWLRAQAAMAVAAGLSREEALAAVTSRAAAILGVDHELGSIRPGAEATLVLFDGDPLDPTTPVRLTLVEGEILYQR